MVSLSVSPLSSPHPLLLFSSPPLSRSAAQRRRTSPAQVSAFGNQVVKLGNQVLIKAGIRCRSAARAQGLQRLRSLPIDVPLQHCNMSSPRMTGLGSVQAVVWKKSCASSRSSTKNKSLTKRLEGSSQATTRLGYPGQRGTFRPSCSSPLRRVVFGSSRANGVRFYDAALTVLPRIKQS